MHSFGSAEELEHWLRAHEVDVDSWGTGGSKTVATLWSELHQGESQLKSTPLRRLVTVVRVIIRRDERVLVETAQDFDDGRRRYRLQPPSEKMRPDEPPEQAAIRCLQEELGVTAGDVWLAPGSTRRWERERESVSYPGLRTCYRFYSIEANVPGLPDQPFSTREIAPGPGEPPEQAAIRCLQEELGVTAGDVWLAPGSTRRWERERESVSYPGLRTCYRFYSIAANVPGLPDQPFSTREIAPGPGEPVERHFWEWAPLSALAEHLPD